MSEDIQMSEETKMSRDEFVAALRTLFEGFLANVPETLLDVHIAQKRGFDSVPYTENGVERFLSKPDGTRTLTVTYRAPAPTVEEYREHLRLLAWAE